MVRTQPLRASFTTVCIAVAVSACAREAAVSDLPRFDNLPRGCAALSRAVEPELVEFAGELYTTDEFSRMNLDDAPQPMRESQYGCTIRFALSSTTNRSAGSPKVRAVRVLFDIGRGSDPVGDARTSIWAAREYATKISPTEEEPSSLNLGDEALVIAQEDSIRGATSQVTFRLSNMVVDVSASGQDVTEHDSLSDSPASAELKSSVRRASEALARKIAADLDAIING